MRLSTLPLLLAGAFVALLNCSLGTGSEVEGRHGVAEGRAVDINGNPVAGALVRVRQNGYLSIDSKNAPAFDTVTDNRGYFYIDTMPPDSYTVEINKNGETGALRQFVLGGADTTPVLLPQITLMPTGTITGRINLPLSDDTVRPRVALYNVEYMQKTSFVQDFSFGGIPSGVYNLRIEPYPGSRLIVELYDIHVFSDSTTDIGQLNMIIQPLFCGCTSAACDSSAVRRILDANGLHGLPVAAVVRARDGAGRITSLDLSGRSLNSLTKEIGALTRLEKLDVSANHLRDVPEQIGYLRSLEELHLDSNILSDLPAELTYLSLLRVLTLRKNDLVRLTAAICRMNLSVIDAGVNRIDTVYFAENMFPSLDTIRLDGNNLQSLPMAMVYLSPDAVNVRGNRLCAPSSVLADWLTSYDSSWAESQHCPE
jgi:hypothetical protein